MRNISLIDIIIIYFAAIAKNNFLFTINSLSAQKKKGLAVIIKILKKLFYQLFETIAVVFIFNPRNRFIIPSRFIFSSPGRRPGFSIFYI